MNSQYKKLLFFFSFVFFSMQQTVKSQELHIGDHTKDMVIRHIINYPKTTATLKDFRAELTIIDFWTTNCSGCVESFPHMDAMQKKYGQKISILFVTRQPQSIILDFLSIIRIFIYRICPLLPAIRCYPLGFLMVRYRITSGWTARVAWWPSRRIGMRQPEHIDSFMKNGSITLKVKKNDRFIDPELPMMTVLDTGDVARSCYYSYLMPSSGHTPNMHQVATTGSSQINHVMLNEASFLDLIRYAYNERGKYDFNPDNTILLQVKDSGRYKRPRDPNRLDGWIDQNEYLYELRIPANQASRMHDIMKDDLTRFMPVDIRIEQREVDCMVLVRTDSASHQQPVTDSFYIESVKTDSGMILTYHNEPWDQLFTDFKHNLSFERNPAPLIDATGLPSSFRMSFSSRDIYRIKNQRKIDMQGFRALLNKYGVDFVVKKWKTDVLVITDR